MRKTGVSKSTDFLLEDTGNPVLIRTPEQTTVRSGGRRHPFEEIDTGFLLLKKYEEEMRIKPTLAEETFRKLLIENKIRFFFQKALYPYIVDFLIYDKKLIIEIDGSFHNTNINQQSYDMRRDEYLMSFGFGLWRFSNKYILNHSQKVLSQLKNYIPKNKFKIQRTITRLSRNHKNYLFNKFRRVLFWELHKKINHLKEQS